MNQQYQAAAHEAGHFLITRFYNKNCYTSIFLKDGLWIGNTKSFKNKLNEIAKKKENHKLNQRDTKYLEKMLMICCAGKAAEIAYFKKENIKIGNWYYKDSDSSDQSDYGDIEYLLLERKKLYINQNEKYLFVENFINNNYKTFKKILNALIERKIVYNICGFIFKFKIKE